MATRRHHPHHRHQHRPSHTLIPLLLLVLAVNDTSQPASADCSVEDFHLSYFASLYTDLVKVCGSRTIEAGNRCRLPPSMCSSSEIMVYDFECAGDTWQWPADTQFCAEWTGCVWQNDTLTCDGSDSYHVASIMPGNLDHRLRAITVINYAALAALSPLFVVGVPLLERIVIRNTGILGVVPGTWTWLRNLKHVDLRNNSIGTIDAGVFPPTGRLEHLDLRGNADLFIGATELHSAMDTCNPLAPLHQVFVDNNDCTVTIDSDGCQRIECSGLRHWSPVFPCLDGSNLTYPQWKMCDGEADCPDGSDEDTCAGILDVSDMASSPQDATRATCALLRRDMLPYFEVRGGIIVLNIPEGADLAVIFLNLPVLGLAVTDVDNAYRQARNLFVLLTWDMQQASGEFLLVEPKITCNYTFTEIARTSSTSTERATTLSTTTTAGTTSTTTGTTKVPTTNGSGTWGAGKGSQEMSAGVVVAAVVLPCALVVVGLALMYVTVRRRRGRTQFSGWISQCAREVREDDWVRMVWP